MRRNSSVSRTTSCTLNTHKLATWFAGIIVLTAVGCQIPKLCCARKAAPLPQTFQGRTSSCSSANIGIENFFGDPVLICLIKEGLSSNQKLMILNEEVRIANAEILARRGAYLPFLSLRAEGGMERTSKYTPLGAAEDQLTYPGGGSFPDPLGHSLLSADFFWRIDIWKEFRNAQAAAMQRRVKAVEERNFYVTELVADIAENYYKLASLDKRLDYLNQTIKIQQHSYEVAKSQKEAARGTELGVQRFLAEVRKNESQMLIVKQQIVEAENRINLLVGRYPRSVERISWDYINLDARQLCVGTPSELLLNRRDIRAAEREVAASGLDVLVARAQFFPRVDITARVGFESFDPRYLFDPEAFIANAAAGLVAPLINKKAIRAEYISANARQIQAIYDYQQTVLNAFAEVVNQMAKVDNYRQSVELKQGQVKALEESVDVATQLFQNARAEYVEVLLSQRDLLEARTDLIETKQEQLAAIVSAYQALGGGYLMTSAGNKFSDVYCPEDVLDPSDVLLPPMPDEMNPSSASGKASLQNEEVAPPPVPAENGEKPAVSEETPAAVPSKSDAPGNSGVGLPATRSEDIFSQFSPHEVRPLFSPGDLSGLTVTSEN